MSDGFPAADLLLEIGLEECPARFVAGALAALEAGVSRRLEEARLAHGAAERFGTPRRLAVLVRSVAGAQAERVEEVKGPPARAAFTADGKPTQAAVGFARNQGLVADDLQVRSTPQGEYVFAVRREPGRPALEVLPGLLADAIRSIEFPKSMRWGAGDLRFVRPIRWLVALCGAAVVPVRLEELVAGRESRGHRFLAPGSVVIGAAGEYRASVAAAGVIADPEERRQRTWAQVAAAAEAAEARVRPDAALLDEITHLVEYPTALVGRFDPAFLALPEEVLVTPMREHQRYFPLVGPDGRLLPRFVAVRNGGELGLANVRQGNERVLAARLADARFFFEEDLKIPLPERVRDLGRIVFQEGLGTLLDKVERVERLTAELCRWAGATGADAAAAARAAHLCKADLTTRLVSEFPELQGIMGREYARRAGEPEAVATAIAEHYQPRGAGDTLPQSLAGALLALADKMDAIAGCFGVGLVPSGSQDPYGLRRQAIGIVRIVLERRLPIELVALIEAAVAGYGPKIASSPEVAAAVSDFLNGRLRTQLAEMGFRHGVIEAVLARGPGRAWDALDRAKSLAEISGKAAEADLLVAYQRVANLAARATYDAVQPERLVQPAERALWEAYLAAHERVSALVARGAYAAALTELAGLRPLVDRLFTEVMVMDEDLAIRANRLALLRRLADLFGQVADLSKL